MIEINKTWFNTSSKEVLNNDICINSYSKEHSFKPFKGGLLCVICNKQFNKRETF